MTHWLSTSKENSSFNHLILDSLLFSVWAWCLICAFKERWKGWEGAGRDIDISSVLSWAFDLHNPRRGRKWYLQIWQMREGYRETLYQGHSNMAACAEIWMKSTGKESLNDFVVFPRDRNADTIFSWYRWLRATEQNSKGIRGWIMIHSRLLTDVIILKKCHLAYLWVSKTSQYKNETLRQRWRSSRI